MKILARLFDFLKFERQCVSILLDFHSYVQLHCHYTAISYSILSLSIISAHYLPLLKTLMNHAHPRLSSTYSHSEHPYIDEFFFTSVA